MAETEPIFIAVRVTSDIVERAQRLADRQYGGNRSLVLRNAIVTYLDLKEALGPRFDLVIAELTKDQKPSPL